MLNREVRRQLLDKLGITPQALSQRADRLKTKYGPMTTDEAVYVIAHTEGVDLSRYLQLDTLDRIRSLVPRQLPRPSGQPQQNKTQATKKKKQSTSYPLVKDTLVKTAVELGKDVFPQLFILENSIRALIERHLSKSGSDWWDKLVPKPVRDNVEQTMKREKRYPYREKRGEHPLYYANFKDLKKIILDDGNKTSFADVIVDFVWFEAKMDEVYMARNNLAHSVPFLQDDKTRIALFYRDWARLLETAGEK